MNNNKINKKISNKLFLVIFLVFLPLIINLVVSFVSFSSMAEDGIAINLVGSQRMRTILLSEYTLEYFGAYREGDNESLEVHKEELQNTLDQFNKFNNALVNGDKDLNINKNESEAIVKAFSDLKPKIDTYNNAITNIINGSELENSKEYIIDNKIDLRNEINKIVLLYQEEYNKKIANLKITGIIMSVFGLVILIIGVIIANKSIVNPIKQITNSMIDIAEGDGDLTKRTNIKTGDEIELLGNKFNEFVDNIHNIIKNTKDNANGLDKIASEFKENINGANNDITSVAEESSFVSGNMQGYASIVEEATASMTEISNNSTQISEDLETVTHESEKSLEFASLGEKLINQVVSSNTEVVESTDEVYDNIVDLSSSLERIGQIITLIEGISEQTNLLALNASIEAARAGEQGRGFAVVAEEVRKLAEESKSAIVDIVPLIGLIQEKSDSANKSINVAKDRVKSNEEKSSDAASQFTSILESIREISSLTNNVSKFASQQASIADEMANAMDEVASTTIENTEALDRVNSLIVSSADKMDNINENSQQIYVDANNLKELTNQFKV